MSERKRRERNGPHRSADAHGEQRAEYMPGGEPVAGRYARADVYERADRVDPADPPTEWRNGYGAYGVGRGGGPDTWTPRQHWNVPGPHSGRGPEGYTRSECAIREDVCERLTRHGRIDASRISVRVDNNEVVLEGFVDSRAAKRMAEDTAESVSGVRDVHNRLRIVEA